MIERTWIIKLKVSNFYCFKLGFKLYLSKKIYLSYVCVVQECILKNFSCYEWLTFEARENIVTKINSYKYALNVKKIKVFKNLTLSTIKLMVS